MRRVGHQILLCHRQQKRRARMKCSCSRSSVNCVVLQASQRCRFIYTYSTKAEPCNIPQLQQSRTPFTHIPKLLAQGGWVLENWPEDVPFPCDIPIGKGIASLPICHREPLLLAFDHPHYPLRVVRKCSECKHVRFRHGY